MCRLVLLAAVEEHPLPVASFHFDADVTKSLDDKFAFAETARSFGLSVPKSFKITDPEQVLNFDFSQEKRKYILKSISVQSWASAPPAPA